jgi:hypothetical protein
VAGRASKKAKVASRDKPNKNDLREHAGPFASPFMPGPLSRAAIRLCRQICRKTLNNIPCRKQYPMPLLALQYLLTRGAATHGKAGTNYKRSHAPPEARTLIL